MKCCGMLSRVTSFLVIFFRSILTPPPIRNIIMLIVEQSESIREKESIKRKPKSPHSHSSEIPKTTGPQHNTLSHTPDVGAYVLLL